VIRTTAPPETLERLDAYADVFSGIGVSKEIIHERPGERLPVIGVRDLDNGLVAAIAGLDRVGFADPSRALKHAVEVGDVLLTGRGTLLKFGLVGPETTGAVASGNIIVVRPHAGVEGAALYAILSSEVFRPKIELLRRGATTLLSLSPKDVAKLEVAVPPPAEQHLIAELVRSSITAYRSAIEAADLRRSLARALMDERLFRRKRAGD